MKIPFHAASTSHLSISRQIHRSPPHLPRAYHIINFNFTTLRPAAYCIIISDSKSYFADDAVFTVEPMKCHYSGRLRRAGEAGISIVKCGSACVTRRRRALSKHAVIRPTPICGITLHRAISSASSLTHCRSYLLHDGASPPRFLGNLPRRYWAAPASAE